MRPLALQVPAGNRTVSLSEHMVTRLLVSTLVLALTGTMCACASAHRAHDARPSAGVQASLSGMPKDFRARLDKDCSLFHETVRRLGVKPNTPYSRVIRTLPAEISAKRVEISRFLAVKPPPNDAKRYQTWIHDNEGITAVVVELERAIRTGKNPSDTFQPFLMLEKRVERDAKALGLKVCASPPFA